MTEEARDFSWVAEGREDLAKAIRDDYLETATAEHANAAKTMAPMRPAEFVHGSTKEFYWEATAKDGDVIIHLFPMSLPEGFIDGFEEILKEVYEGEVPAGQGKLEIGYAPEVTPSWIHADRHPQGLPSYPSWCITLRGYAELDHTHQRLVGDAFDKIVAQVQERK